MDLNPLIREAQGTHIEAVLLDVRGHRPLADGQLPEEALHSAKNWLDAHGLILDENLASQFGLTYDGQRLADALHRSRTSGEGRRDAVTRAVAEAIDAGEDEREVATVDGVEVTDRERQIVLDRLARWDLISVVRSGGEEIVRADARPALAEVTDVQGLLKDHYEGRGIVDQRVSNTTHVSGGTIGGFQTGGSGNTMHVTQTITPSDQADVFARVSEILRELDEVEGAEELRGAVEAIQEAAAQPDQSRPGLRQKVFEAMAVAGATQGVEKATVLMSQLLASLMG